MQTVRSMIATKPKMNLMMGYDEKGERLDNVTVIRDTVADDGTVTQSAIQKLSDYGPIAGSTLGARHVQMPFQQHAEMTFSVLREFGYNPHSPEFHLTHNLQRCFAAFYLGKSFDDVGDIELDGVLKGSYDQSTALGDALGTYAAICSNLSIFSGNLCTVSHKNTINAPRTLRERFELGVSHIEGEFQKEAQRIEKMRDWNISERWTHHLMVGMARAKVFNWSEIPKVLSEYNEPTQHETGRHEPGIAWSLENAVTQILKPRFAKNPNDAAKRTTKMTAQWHKALADRN